MSDILKKDWKGYSLDEIRFQRILALTRIDIEKSKLLNAFSDVSSGRKQANSMIGRMAGALNVLDYALIAFTIGRRLIKFFRRRK